MIVTKIIGGLGNQMFQYAAGQALAQSWNVEHRIDVEGFKTYALHNGFQLKELFDVPSAEAGPDLCGQLKRGNSGAILLRKVLNYFSKPPSSYVLETQFNYLPLVEAKVRDIYLDGYWQTERYFLDKKSEIQNVFSFKKPLSDRSVQVAKKIETVNSVSIHVRRGDYTNLQALTYHGLLGLNYYIQAISTMRGLVKNPHFFIFSDDIEWCRQNLQLNDSEADFIDFNAGADSWQDMKLMSLCKHNIIANSSFSWWGAWLNTDQQKQVIAPAKWFFTDKLNDVDVVPKNWIRVPSSFVT